MLTCVPQLQRYHGDIQAIRVSIHLRSTLCMMDSFSYKQYITMLCWYTVMCSIYLDIELERKSIYSGIFGIRSSYEVRCSLSKIRKQNPILYSVLMSTEICLIVRPVRGIYVGKKNT